MPTDAQHQENRGHRDPSTSEESGLERWFENDAFWEKARDILFSRQRMEAAVEEVEQAIRLLELRPGQHVLDLCCGIGRHALELSRRGLRVTGVDRTSAFLEEARRHAASEGLEVEFVREDARRFCRPEAFDAVINMFTSFGYSEDPQEDALILRNAHASLRPGGGMLMDIVGKEVIAARYRERDWYQDGDAILLEERRLVGPWERIQTRWILLVGDRREELELSLRLYAATELRDLFRRCGFREVRVFGDLAGAPYDQGARRLVVVARK
jgi:SAM-dependent methyltransferase